MTPEITEKYGNRLRTRVCALCWQDDKLLMVNHKQLTERDFWAPPGGGIEFGETTHEALIREVQEETSLVVSVGAFQFACELIRQPLHAVELFFEVIFRDGTVATGRDPESTESLQIIHDVKYLSIREILLLPDHERHGIFNHVSSAAELRKLAGFYRI